MYDALTHSSAGRKLNAYALATDQTSSCLPPNSVSKPDVFRRNQLSDPAAQLYSNKLQPSLSAKHTGIHMRRAQGIQTTSPTPGMSIPCQCSSKTPGPSCHHDLYTGLLGPIRPLLSSSAKNAMLAILHMDVCLPYCP